MLVQTLGSTPSATARATGLSRMTIHRVRDGVTSPTLATLRELALAAGYDLDVKLVPASDPAAAVAARVLADPATPGLASLGGWELLDPGELEAVTEWVRRLERQVPESDRKLLEIAGRAAAPQHRKGARYFAPKPGLGARRLTEIAASALGDRAGALSGVAAAFAYLGHAPDPGALVVWAMDADDVAGRLQSTLREADEFQPGGVIVAPTMRAALADRVGPPVVEHPVVSPIQAAIDLRGLGYDDLADEITEGW